MVWAKYSLFMYLDPAGQCRRAREGESLFVYIFYAVGPR